MKRHRNIFSSRYSKLSGSVLLLMLTSSLFACGQADNIDATNISDIPNSMVQNENSAVMTTLVSNPDLLKNVSATVYKDPNCGCCKEWVGYAEGHGLTATAHDVADLSVFKDRYGVPQQMRSCHTTVTTDGYVFEGHVPAKHMAQFLENPPVGAIGLAVPSMPVGSPGMEYQGKFMPYKVMQLNNDGTTEVYAAIESPEQQT